MIWLGAFVIGLVIGSFLNVIIIRIDDWKSIVTGRSHCMDCKTQLRWYDLIPVISYATLKGRCRYCAKPISHQYPIVEITTGLLAMMAYYLIISSSLTLALSVVSYILLLLVFCCLVVLFFHDVETMTLPEGVSYVLVISAFAFASVYYHDLRTIVYGALTGLIPISLLVYPSKGKWMGEGDVKIAVSLGVLTGFPGSVLFIFLSFLLGGLYGAVLLLLRKAQLKTAVPFAPFLITASLIVLFFGKYIFDWYYRFIGI